MMKRVWLICRDYYPNGNISSHRPGAMVRYLPDHGWQPSVICPRWTPHNCPFYDPTTVPQRETTTIIAEGEVLGLERVPLAKKLTLALKLLRCPSALKDRLLYHLAAWAGMRHPAEFYHSVLHKALLAAKSNPPDLIWATYPEGAALSLGKTLAEAANCPWVADFRDIFEQPTIGTCLRKSPRFFKDEVRTLSTARAITTVSEPLAEALRSRHQAPVSVIPNGFDIPSELPEQTDQATHFTLLYTGSLYFPHRDPRPLLRALETLLDSGKLDARAVLLRYCGTDKEIMRKLLKDYPLTERISQLQDSISHIEALAAQRSAHVLVHLSQAGKQGILTGKIFEYLAARRLILTVPGDRDVVEALLQETQGGVAAASPEAIAKQLLRWYEIWQREGDLHANSDPQAINKYSRSSQVKAFAELFDHLVKQ